jgi:prolyl oligopeptidase
MTPAFAAQPDAPAEDSHLWLEDVTGEKQLAWVRERNAESTQALTSGTGFAAIERRILAILNSKERIPAVTKIGDRYYNFWRDAANPKGV